MYRLEITKKKDFIKSVFQFSILTLTAFFVLLASFFLFQKINPIQADGLEYYVSADDSCANDSNNGLYPDCSLGGDNGPFATIQHAADTISAGDTVYLREGIYYETTINFAVSGTTESSKVTITNYETETPIIDATLYPEATWSLQSGSVYYTATTDAILTVIADSVGLRPAENVESLTDDTFYYDSVNNLLYVQLANSGNPNSQAMGIIKNTSDIINTFNVRTDHLILDGVTIRHSQRDAVNVYKDSSSGRNDILINNCTLEFSKMRGFYAYKATNTIIQNSTIRNNVLENWPRGTMTSGGWGQGVSFNSGSYNSALSNEIYLNNGEGLGAYGLYESGPNNVTFNDNKIYDNWGVNAYIDGAEDITVDGNFIYVTDNRPVEDDDEKRRTPTGINLSREQADNPTDLDNIIISNNIIVNCFSGISLWYVAGEIGMTNSLITNNTIVNHNNNLNSWTAFRFINSDYTGTYIRNNIIQQANGNFTSAYGINFSNNLWYTTDTPLYVYDGTTYNSYTTFTSGTSQDNNGDFDNPLFTTGTGLIATNYNISSSSPAIEMGYDVSDSGITTDYNNNTRPQDGDGDSTETYDVGAFEYEIPQYTLSINKINSGTVTGTSINCGETCSADYSDGTSVTLTATPATGYSFTGWSGDCSGTDTCTVSMTEDKSVTANFVINQYSLTTTTNGSGNITATGIDCGSDCSQDFDYNTSVTLTATPTTGYSFTGWSGDCSGTDTCTVSMTEDKSVIANFSLIETTEEDETENVENEITTNNEDTTSNEATETAINTTQNTEEEVNDNNKQETPIQNIKEFQIIAKTNTGGTIIPSGTILVREGDNQEFQINPDKNYIIKEINIDNKYTENSNVYTFNNVKENHTIEAIFEFVGEEIDLEENSELSNIEDPNQETYTEEEISNNKSRNYLYIGILLAVPTITIPAIYFYSVKLRK